MFKNYHGVQNLYSFVRTSLKKFKWHTKINLELHKRKKGFQGKLKVVNGIKRKKKKFYCTYCMAFQIITIHIKTYTYHKLSQIELSQRKLMLINAELFPLDRIYHAIQIGNKLSWRNATSDPFLYLSHLNRS